MNWRRSPWEAKSCRLTKAQFEPTDAQFDKLTADAAEYKAGFDKALYDNIEQKAQVGGGRWA